MKVAVDDDESSVESVTNRVARSRGTSNQTTGQTTHVPPNHPPTTIARLVSASEASATPAAAARAVSPSNGPTSATSATSATSTTSAAVRNGRRRVTKIQIRAGAIVDGIEMMYSDDPEGKACGGADGSGAYIMLPEGEHVVRIDLTYNRKYITRIGFVTSRRRQLGPCGGGGALFLGGTSNEEVSVAAPAGCMLVGIHGRAGKYLNALGFYWASVDQAQSKYFKSKAHGGSGGKPFDHVQARKEPKKVVTKQRSFFDKVCNFVSPGDIDILYKQQLYFLGDKFTGTIELGFHEPVVETRKLVVKLKACRKRSEKKQDDSDEDPEGSTEILFSYEEVLHEEKVYNGPVDKCFRIPFAIQLPRSIRHEVQTSGMLGNMIKAIQDIDEMTSEPIIWTISASLSLPLTQGLGLNVEKKLYVDEKS